MNYGRLPLLTATAILLALSAPVFAGDQEAGANAATRVFETPNGNTATVHKRLIRDAEGNARAVRRYRVTDEDGETIAAGRNRVIKRADGAKSATWQRGRVTDDGSTIRRSGYIQQNTDGDRRAAERGIARDADGSPTRIRVRRQVSRD